MADLENVVVKTIAVDGIDIVYRWDHIRHYLIEGVIPRAVALSPEDKDRFFKMVEEYEDIIDKVLVDPYNPISIIDITIDPNSTDQIHLDWEAWKAKQ